MLSHEVTLYTKPGCVQCDFTKKYLVKLGIKHTVIDISTDPSAVEVVRALGYQAMPVVVVDEDLHWQGFSPDRLNGLVEEVAA